MQTMYKINTVTWKLESHIVVRKTAKFLIIQHTSTYGPSKGETYERRIMDDGTYFETWEEANEFRIQRLKQNTEVYTRLLREAHATLARVQGETDPEIVLATTVPRKEKTR